MAEYYHPGSVNCASVVAGKAATELILGETDMGTEKDIRSAFNQVEKILDNVSAYDFYSWCHGEENFVL